MKTNETKGMNAKNSNSHTVDESSTRDIEFLRLTTDICYVIGGFFGGKLPESGAFIFMNDFDEIVLLDLDERFILADDSLSRAKIFALETIAKDHGFEFDIFNEKEQ